MRCASRTGCAGALLLLLLAKPWSAAAQQALPYTLHVYTNLVEVPVLAVQPDLRAVKGLDPHSFLIRIDNGQPFAPSFVRREGDDPLSVAFVLDDSLGQEDEVRAQSEAIQSLADGSLRPTDHVLIVIKRCGLARISTVSAVSRQTLGGALEQVPQVPKPSSHAEKAACRPGADSLNVLAYTAEHLRALPGRRVIVDLAAASDQDYTPQWKQLQYYISPLGMSVFELRPPFPALLHDPVSELSGSSGGLALVASPPQLAGNLRHMLTLLRERYILDFPRPADARAGRAVIYVTLRHPGGAIVRSSGVTVPLPTSDELKSQVQEPASFPPSH